MQLVNPINFIRGIISHSQEGAEMMPPSQPYLDSTLKGPPIHTGLSKTAILFQMHTHLAKLEDNQAQITEAIHMLRLALDHLMKQKDGPCSCSGTQPVLRDLTTSAKATQSGSQGSMLSSTQPAFVVSQKKKKKQRLQTVGASSSTKPEILGVSLQKAPTAQQSHLPRSQQDQAQKTSLISRASGLRLRLGKNKDPPASSTPRTLEGDSQPPQGHSLQVKQLPDGSFVGRLKGQPKQPARVLQGKSRKYTPNRRRAFSPPPAIGTTASTQSVQVREMGAAPRCPPNPFIRPSAPSYQR